MRTGAEGLEILFATVAGAVRGEGFGSEVWLVAGSVFGELTAAGRMVGVRAFGEDGALATAAAGR